MTDLQNQRYLHSEALIRHKVDLMRNRNQFSKFMKKIIQGVGHAVIKA